MTTWKAEDGTIWARDLLPKRIPDIRVFTYGYPGTLKSLTDLPTRRKTALELLQLLEAERKQFPASTRPIIWVGHGLGGWIIKKVRLYSLLRFTLSLSIGRVNLTRHFLLQAIIEARYNSTFMPIFHFTFGVVSLFSSDFGMTPAHSHKVE